MPSLFRSLLYLYPADYRQEYGEEMLGVLFDVKSEQRTKGVAPLLITYFRESGGLLKGALQERTRRVLFPQGVPNFSPRRLPMRSEFRFPKSTVTMMTIVLLVVAITIDKAKSLQASIPPSSSPVPPINPEHFTIVGTFLAIFALAAVCSALVWAFLYAINRSGTQRLSELKPSGSPGSANRS
jgi:hypothetical protein